MASFVHLVPFRIIIKKMKLRFVVIGIPGLVQCNERSYIKRGIRASHYDELFTIEAWSDDRVGLCGSSQDNG
jgi:hypothetical protein